MNVARRTARPRACARPYKAHEGSQSDSSHRMFQVFAMCPPLARRVDINCKLSPPAVSLSLSFFLSLSNFQNLKNSYILIFIILTLSFELPSKHLRELVPGRSINSAFSLSLSPSSLSLYTLFLIYLLWLREKISDFRWSIPLWGRWILNPTA